MKKILVVAPAWVGDMVMAQTLFAQLKTDKTELTILAPTWTADVASRMPEVDHIITTPFTHGGLQLKERYQLGLSLRKKAFNEAYILPNSLKASLIPFFANIPKRIGFLGEYRYVLLTDPQPLNKKKLPRTIDRFLYLKTRQYETTAIINPHLNIDIEQLQATQARYHINTPYIALCPGAEFGHAKQWPIDYFIEIAKKASDKNYQVILLGSKKDQAITNQIANQAKNTINLAGLTSITQAIDLLSGAKMALSNDSGLMHIAAAVNTKVFVIYGSTSPKMTPPLSDKATIIENNQLKCRPCFDRECQKSGSENMACMHSITVEQVAKIMGI